MQSAKNDYDKTTKRQTTKVKQTMKHPTTEFDTEEEAEFPDDVDFPHEQEQSYLDVNLTEASVYLELSMNECDDSEISQDIMRSYRSLITALTKAQERRDDE